jgi:RimJ/RimL family protein N-acetyltransferase
LQDFGYGVLPSYRRQGYATEAAVAVLNYWRHDFGLTSISGFCLPTNAQSNAMLTKLGFEFAGNALLNGSIIINGYVLPGMKHFTPETCQFNRWGVEKAEVDAVKR